MRAKRCENLKEAWKQVAWEKNEREACYVTKMKMVLSTYLINARWNSQTSSLNMSMLSHGWSCCFTLTCYMSCDVWTSSFYGNYYDGWW